MIANISALTRIGSKLNTHLFYIVLNNDTSEVERDLCAFGPIGGVSQFLPNSSTNI